MTPKKVAPEALQSGAGMVMPGVGGMIPPPITRPPKKVGQETCAVCAEGQGLCACPSGGMGLAAGAAMVGAKYVGTDLLSAPVVGAPPRATRASMGGGPEQVPELPTVGEGGFPGETQVMSAFGGGGAPGMTEAFPTSGFPGMTTAATETVSVPFTTFARYRPPTVAQQPAFRTVVTPNGPMLTHTPQLTIAQAKVEEIKVNFNFGKGTKAADRDKNAETFVKALNKALENTPAGKSRFGVKFTKGDVKDSGDVPENLSNGGFTNGPGTYVYSDEIMDLTKKHGRTAKEPAIKVIVVKGLQNRKGEKRPATTVSEKIDTKTKTKDPKAFQDARGENREAIFYDDDSFTSVTEDDTTPAHEVVHLPGLPDHSDPTDQEYKDKRLNTYAKGRETTLSTADEKTVNDYFKGKVKP